MNQAFGLDYWSNRINAWEDFPDVRGTINGSLGAEFQKFQRTLVDDYLQWQADIVKEYAREDQFTPITSILTGEDIPTEYSRW